MSTAIEKQVTRKIFLRLLPLLICLYIISYLDAGNPAARTDFRHEQVAGYFEQAVTDEEQARAPAIV